MPALRRFFSLLCSRPLYLALLGLAIGLAVTGSRGLSDRPDAADSGQYLTAAYHLDQYGVFSERSTRQDPGPGLGREPGWGAALAALRLISPDLSKTEPVCINSNEGCGKEMYGAVIWTQRLMILASGLAVFLTALHLTGSRLAAFGSGVMIWANSDMQSSFDYAVSDYFALFCLCLFLMAAAYALFGRASATSGEEKAGILSRLARPRPLADWRFALLAGLAMAALILTKAVFWYFLLLLIPALGLLALFQKGRPRNLAVLLLFALLSAGPVLGWMSRNAALGGQFGVPGDNRSGIALNTRMVFHDMTPEQGLAAMIFWTRGFGDDLARALFDEPVWKPLQFYEDDGFYYRGQLGYPGLVRDRAAAEGISAEEAQKKVDRDLLMQGVKNPGTHLLTNIPLFWRGIWVDSFILLTLPALIWLTWQLLRRRAWALLLFPASGWFSLAFYSLLSLNIPRYQIPAVPALALAGGMALAALIPWLSEMWRRRRAASA